MENMMKRVLTVALAFTMVFTGFAGMSMPAYAGAMAYLNSVTPTSTELDANGGNVTLAVSGSDLNENVYWVLQQKDANGSYKTVGEEINETATTSEEAATISVAVPANTKSAAVEYRVRVKEVEPTFSYATNKYNWSSAKDVAITVAAGDGSGDAEATVDATLLKAKVVDADGNPVEGVKVALYDDGLNFKYKTLTSDAQGMVSYAFQSYDASEYSLYVSDDAYTCDTVYEMEVDTDGIVTIDGEDFTGEENMTFTVAAAGGSEPEGPDTPSVDNKTINIKAVDAEGNPVEGVSFKLQSSSSYAPLVPGKTNAEGMLSKSVGYWSGNFTLMAQDNIGYAVVTPVTIVCDMDDNYDYYIQSVNGSAYTGLIEVVVETAEITPDPEVQSVTTDITSVSSKGGQAVVTVKGVALPEQAWYKIMYTSGGIDMAVNWAGTAINWTGTDTEKTFTVDIPAVSSIEDEVEAFKVAVSIGGMYANDYNKNKSAAIEIAEPEEPIDMTKWEANDFTYGNQSFALTSKTNGAKQTFDVYCITGLSERGQIKIAENKTLVLPAVDTEGTPVYGVGASAFKNMGITSLTIPASAKVPAGDFTLSTSDVTERGNYFIGNGAFLGNELTSVEIPEGVLYIGNTAFSTNKLTAVKLPSTVYQIGSQAFVGKNTAATTNLIETIDFPAATDYGMELDVMSFGLNRVEHAILPSNIEYLCCQAFVNNFYDPATKEFKVVKLYKVGSIDGAKLGYIGHNSSADTATYSKNNKYQSMAEITEDMIGMDFDVIDVLAAKNKELADKAKELAEKAEALAAMAQELETIQAADAAKQAEIERLAGELTAKAEALEAMAQELESAQAADAAKQAEIEKLAGELATKADELAAMAKALEDANKANDDKQAEIEKLEKEILALKLDGAFLGLKAKADNYNTVTLTWTPNAEAAGYAIFMKTDKSDEWAQVKTPVAGTESSFVFNGLATGTTYQFKVVAGKGDVQGAEATATAKPVLKRVAAPVVKSGKKAVTASWKKVAGATGYQMSVSTTKTGTKIVKTGNVVKYTKKSLKAKKTYYVKVRAYRTVNGKKVFGAWSTVKSIKTK